MAYQIIEYMEEHPDVDLKDVIKHFSEQMDIYNQLSYLHKEVDEVLELRSYLRPLYGKKMNLDSNLAILESDFEMQVFNKYPPRQGSDKERKAYKKELQQASSDYKVASAELEKIKEEIGILEEKMSDTQQRAKNARRILETFNVYMQFLVGNVHLFTEADRPVKPNKNIF